MSQIPLEKRFTVLCEIVRAQHFAWREAVSTLCPGIDPRTVVERMWEITGRESARAYLRRLDSSQPLAPQVAASIAFASACMGETVEVEVSGDRDEAFVRHRDCPWLRWHRMNDLLGEDRPGCDRWFVATVEGINRELGTSLKVETLGTLPDGDPCCVRRLWRDGPPARSERKESGAR